MTNKQEFITVTHDEIICLAIKELDREIADFEENATDMGEQVQDIITRITKPLREKRDVLKMLYEIETGTEYN